jgi:hypothetical protein
MGSNSGNSYTIQNKGPCTVTFKDTNQRITFELPKVVMSGIIWGTQSLTITHSLIIVDEANSLKAHISFGENNKDPHHFTGLLYKYDKSDPNNDPTKSVSKVKDIEQEIAQISGNWEGFLDIGGKVEWDKSKMSH